MIIETAIKAVAETATAKSEIAALDKAGVEKLAPVEVVGVGPLKISAIVENIPLVEEHARFFSAPEFKEMTITDLPDVQGIRIEFNGEFIDIPLAEGTVLDAVGVRDLIAYAMDPAIEQFIQLRLEELARKSGEVVDPVTGDVGSSEGLIYQPRYPDLYHTIVNGFRESLGYPPIEAPPELPDGAITIISSDVPVFPSPLIIASPLSQFGDLLQKLESAVADRLPEGTCLTAKRIDYLVGDQYVAGHLAELPILGGVSDIVFKGKLGEAVTKEDWIEVAGDVMVIAPIAVAPLLPLTGVAAIAGWVATSATFQGLAFGLTEMAKGGQIGEVSEQAGKGALIGAITGVVGGVAVAKVMPAIASPLLSHVAAGSLTGTAATITEATIHVIEKGANLEDAAKEIGLAALEGATIGGGVGGLSLGVSKIVGKLVASPNLTTAMSESLEKGSLKQCLERTRTGPYCMGKTEGFFRRLEGHVDSLGDISGVRKNLSIMAGNSENAAKGAFTELGAAAAFKKAGHDIAAVGKIVNVPGVGNTDIDVLTRAGKWIEKKHVKQISCDEGFRTKIDKMSEALKSGMEVSLDDGNLVKITDSIFVNSGKISAQAIRYAESKGVTIYQTTPYTQVPS